MEVVVAQDCVGNPTPATYGPNFRHRCSRPDDGSGMPRTGASSSPGRRCPVPPHRQCSACSAESRTGFSSSFPAILLKKNCLYSARQRGVAASPDGGCRASISPGVACGSERLSPQKGCFLDSPKTIP
jgi:hypothetical protein